MCGLYGLTISRTLQVPHGPLCRPCQQSNTWESHHPLWGLWGLNTSAPLTYLAISEKHFKKQSSCHSTYPAVLMKLSLLGGKPLNVTVVGFTVTSPMKTSKDQFGQSPHMSKLHISWKVLTKSVFPINRQTLIINMLSNTIWCKTAIMSKLLTKRCEHLNSYVTLLLSLRLNNPWLRIRYCRSRVPGCLIEAVAWMYTLSTWSWNILLHCN